jgi:MAX-like protein X
MNHQLLPPQSASIELVTSAGDAMSGLLSLWRQHQQQLQQQPQQQQQQPQQGQRKRSFTEEASDHRDTGQPTNFSPKEKSSGHPRVHVMTAEYKRRCAIKDSFETLNRLVPSLNGTDCGKINKAVILIKAAKYCQRLKDEKELMMHELSELQKEVATLQNEISSYQSQLPATGAPSTTSSIPHHMVQLYDNYVQMQTIINWKFWIFNLIICQLFDTFVNAVGSVNYSKDLSRGVLAWIQDRCSLVSLRPVVLSSLRKLSTSTSILTDPSLVPRQATEAVSRRSTDRQ